MIAAFILSIQAASSLSGLGVADYDCNVAQGQSDKKFIIGGKDELTISGTIKLEDAQQAVTQWLPAAGVLFQPPERKGGIGLQLWLNQQGKLAYGVRRLGPGSDSPTQLGELSTDQPIAFSLSLDRSRAMTVQVNGQTYKIKGISLRPNTPFLMCSGGHFRFSGLRVVGAD